jgi:hypothetical protein
LLRRLKNEKDVYYCYLCEHQKKRQQLFIVDGSGKILNHHEGSHRIGRESGDRKREFLPRNRPLWHSFANLCSSCYYDELKRPEALIIVCAISIGDPVYVFRVYLTPTSMPTTSYLVWEFHFCSLSPFSLMLRYDVSFRRCLALSTLHSCRSSPSSARQVVSLVRVS